jgi:hypothetical protein
MLPEDRQRVRPEAGDLEVRELTPAPNAIGKIRKVASHHSSLIWFCGIRGV